MSSLSNFLKCKRNHVPTWVVTYDIGQEKTEMILVCEACYVKLDDDRFRRYAIKRESLSEISKSNGR